MLSHSSATPDVDIVDINCWYCALMCRKSKIKKMIDIKSSSRFFFIFLAPNVDISKRSKPVFIFLVQIFWLLSQKFLSSLIHTFFEFEFDMKFTLKAARFIHACYAWYKFWNSDVFHGKLLQKLPHIDDLIIKYSNNPQWYFCETFLYN